MTIRDLFEYVDEVMENVFSAKVKLRWVNQIEAELQTNVLLLAADSIVRYGEDDMDAELLAPPPFDELYTEYLQYRICLAQEEPERANNKAVTYNRIYTEYQIYIAQTANPGNGMAEKMLYYLSAYSLAVKHGYVGTEKEWVNSLPGKDGVDGTGVKMEFNEESGMLEITVSDSADEESGSSTGGNGTPGVGVSSVDQTVVSAEDGGVNEWTMTLTDGTTAVLQVRNGSKGSRGYQGVGVKSVQYDAETRQWSWTDTDNGTHKFTGPDIYSREDIDTMFGDYITDVAALVGGDA